MTVMDCVYHPSHDASGICEQCRADLCRSCTIQCDDGRTLCHRCMLALSVEQVKNETTERQLSHEARRLGLGGKWRPAYLQIVITMGTVLAVLLISFYLLGAQPEPPPEIVLDPANPVELLASLQAALELYAAAHEGQYPKNLYDLIGNSLADTPLNRRALRDLSYKRDQSEGYRLQVKSSASVSGEGLVATADDMHPSE
ncbi:MAG: hypothetical protein JSU72_13650 [Deltaproteobacteria bacterium]|nr:MAG: hypothetical protein JSU72_13650 [Deltaproteobacteria bacterium]